MRYAPGHKEKTRARILEAAGRMFRRLGYHATGVDRVMEEAGLTAGGFYAHFDSKQALLAKVIGSVGSRVKDDRGARLAGLSGVAWLDAFLTGYLSMGHRDAIEGGCPVVALVSEVARAGEPVKVRFEAIVQDLKEALTAHAREDSPDVSEPQVLAVLALCVGGLGLARSIQDQGLAERMLESCRDQALKLLGTPEKSSQTACRQSEREGA